MSKPICSKCVYCRPYEWSKRLRAWDCKHPNANDGSMRFSLNLIGGRVDVNSAFAHAPTIKGSPKWCPLRKEAPNA